MIILKKFKKHNKYILQFCKIKLKTYFLDIAKSKVKIINNVIINHFLFSTNRNSINLIPLFGSSIKKRVSIFYSSRYNASVSILYILLSLIYTYIRFL